MPTVPTQTNTKKASPSHGGKWLGLAVYLVIVKFLVVLVGTSTNFYIITDFIKLLLDFLLGFVFVKAIGGYGERARKLEFLLALEHYTLDEFSFVHKASVVCERTPRFILGLTLECKRSLVRCGQNDSVHGLPLFSTYCTSADR